MLLVIDNYDSFTYNLVQYLGELGQELEVYRNDEIAIADINHKQPDHIVISPGPGRPDKAGISIEIIKKFYQKVPILGVCLGHQAIGEAFGGIVTHAPELVHGKTSMIYHDGQTIYQGIPNPFEATRYHSLIVDKDTLPKELIITSHTQDGIIMGLRHEKYPVEGIQFHPESILTDCGKNILRNFLSLKPKSS